MSKSDKKNFKEDSISKKTTITPEEFGPIEFGVPIPRVKKSSSYYDDLFEKMKPGDSIPVFTKSAVFSISNYARSRGYKGAYRATGNGYRFWLISKNSEKKENS